MKDDNIKYLVYRAYSRKERPYISSNDRLVLYGWTANKDVLNAFFEQRTKKKYKVKKTNDDEIMEVMKDELDADMMIDFIDLKSASTGETIKFFMTKAELIDTEKNIQHIFQDLSRLVDRDNGKMKLLELYVNLDDYYLDALRYIGFNPPELSDLFDSVEYLDSPSGFMDIDGLIDGAYESACDVPHEFEYHQGIIPSIPYMENVSNKILYSVESFIRVLRDDM